MNGLKNKNRTRAFAAASKIVLLAFLFVTVFILAFSGDYSAYLDGNLNEQLGIVDAAGFYGSTWSGTSGTTIALPSTYVTHTAGLSMNSSNWIDASNDLSIVNSGMGQLYYQKKNTLGSHDVAGTMRVYINTGNISGFSSASVTVNFTCTASSGGSSTRNIKTKLSLGGAQSFTTNSSTDSNNNSTYVDVQYSNDGEINQSGSLTTSLTTDNSFYINFGANFWRSTNSSTTTYTVTVTSISLTVNTSASTINFGVSPSGSGSVTPASLTFSSNTESKLVSASPSTGYTFSSWSDNVTSTSRTLYGYNYIRGTTLTANFSAKTYTISYDSNGGSVPSATTITYNTAFSSTNLPTPTRTGYTFAGWWSGETSGNGSGTQISTSSTFSTAISFSTIDHTYNTLTLYAKWTPITYTTSVVTTKPGNASGNVSYGGNTSYPCTYDTVFSVPLPTLTGWKFTGWAVTGSGYNSTTARQGTTSSPAPGTGITAAQTTSTAIYFKNLSSTSDGAVTFSAQWTPIVYYVAFNGNGNTSGSTNTMTCNYDTTYSLTTNGFARTDYVFVGWATSQTGGIAYANGANFNNWTETDDATITLYAVWKGSDFGGKNFGNLGYDWGTEAHPYLIQTAEHLVNLSEIVNGVRDPVDSVNGTFYGNSISGTVGSSKRYEECYFFVTADVTVSGAIGFTPIGTSQTNAFAGAFFGSDETGTKRTITLSSISKASNYCGLFGYIYLGGGSVGTTIRDLTIAGSVSGTSYVGALAGYFLYDLSSNGGAVNNITNISVSATVSGTGDYVGGLIGYGTRVSNTYFVVPTVSTITVTGSVSGGSFVGGVGGYLRDATFIGMTVGSSGTSATVTGSGNNIGGILGHLDGGSITSNGSTSGISKNYMNVVSTGSGTSYVGGITGNTTWASIRSAQNYASVSSTTTGTKSNYVGGVTGSIGVASYLCNPSFYNTSSGYLVENYGSVSGGNYVGGIVGLVDSSNATYDTIVYRGSNSGAVSGASYVGGVIGGCSAGSSTRAVTVRYLSNTSTVTATGDRVGGIAGFVKYVVTVSGTALTNTNTVGGSSYVGGIFGYAENTTLTGGTNSGAVSGTGSVGGIIGRFASGTISGTLSNSGTIIGSSTNVGGVIGQTVGSADADITFSSTTLTNSANVTGSSYAGGIFGCLGGNASGAGVTVTGAQTWTNNSGYTVSGDGDGFVGGISGMLWTTLLAESGSVAVMTNSATVSGGNSIGGITGFTNRAIAQATNNGNVTGTTAVGGIVGRIQNSITNCTNTGNIIATSSYTNGEAQSFVGGFAGGMTGYISGAITNCFNSGAVSCTGGTKNYLGGMTGYSSSAITNCANTGTVTGTDYLAGIVGYTTNTIENCYNTGSFTVASHTGGIVGATTSTVTSSWQIDGSSSWTTSIPSWVSTGTSGTSSRYFFFINNTFAGNDAMTVAPCDSTGSTLYAWSAIASASGSPTTYTSFRLSTDSTPSTYYYARIRTLANEDAYSSTYVYDSRTAGSTNYRIAASNGNNLVATYYYVYNITATLASNPGSVSNSTPSGDLTLGFTAATSTYEHSGVSYSLAQGTAARTGYRLLGWYVSGGNTSSANWSVGGAWTNGFATSLSTTNCFATTTATIITGSVCAYSTWYMRDFGTAGATVALQSVWSANTYTIAFNLSSPGTGTPTTMTSITATYDQASTVDDAALTGYTFAKWTVTGYTTATARYGTSSTYSDASLVSAVSGLVPAASGGNYVWNLTTSQGSTVTFSATSSTNWTANTITVDFDSNKGSYSSMSSTPSTNANTTILYDTVAGASLGTVSVTGWAFVGWYTAASGGTQITGGDGVTDVRWTTSASLSSSGTDTLYAHWTAYTYTVSVATNKPSNASSSVSYSGNTSITFTYDAATNVPLPTLTGWMFTGWSVTGSYNATTARQGTNSSPVSTISNSKTSSGSTYFKNLSSTSGGTVTFTAQWTANIITVNLMTATSASGDWSTTFKTYYVRYDTKNVYSDAAASTLVSSSGDFGTPSALSNYTFYGWGTSNSTASSAASTSASTGNATSSLTNTSGTLSSNWTATASGTRSLYAIYQYRITYNATSGSGSDVTYIYYRSTTGVAYPSSIFTAPTACSFTGWSTSLDGTADYTTSNTHGYCFSTSNPATLYACWETSEYRAYGSHTYTSSDGSDHAQLNGSVVTGYTGGTHSVDVISNYYNSWGIQCTKASTGEFHRASGEIYIDTGSMSNEQFGIFFLDIELTDNMIASVKKGALTFSLYIETSDGEMTATMEYYPFMHFGTYANGVCYNFIKPTSTSGTDFVQGSGYTEEGNQTVSLTPNGNYSYLRIGVFLRRDGNWATVRNFDARLSAATLTVTNSTATTFSSGNGGSVSVPSASWAENQSYYVIGSYAGSTSSNNSGATATANTGNYFSGWTYSNGAASVARALYLTTYNDFYLTSATYTANFAAIAFSVSTNTGHSVSGANGSTYYANMLSSGSSYFVTTKPSDVTVKTYTDANGTTYSYSVRYDYKYLSFASYRAGTAFSSVSATQYTNTNLTTTQMNAEGVYQIAINIVVDGAVVGTSTVTMYLYNGDFGISGSGTGAWGSQTNPYLITNVQHLYNLADIVNNVRPAVNSVNGDNNTSGVQASRSTYVTFSGCYFQVANNVTFAATDHFTPIGCVPTAGGETYKFAGVFDGNSKTVSGLQITRTDNFTGLFGILYGGTVKDLTLSKNGIYGGISGASYTGAFVGYAQNDVTLSGLVNNLNVVSTASYTGGIVGRLCGTSDAVVEVSSNYGSITGVGYVGGLIGHTVGTVPFAAGTLFNSGAITSTGDYAGGVVGHIESVSNFAATTLSNGAAVSGTNYVGGIIGGIYNASSYVLSGSITATNTGNVTASGGYVGGVVGYYYVATNTTFTFSSCTNSGNVVCTNGTSGSVADAYTGGIVGGIQLYAGSSTISLSSCTNSGGINSSTYKYGNFAGGILGRVWSVQYYGVNLTSCSNTATVYGYNDVGGIIGFQQNTTLTNCTNGANGTSATVNGNFEVGGITGKLYGGTLGGSDASVNTNWMRVNATANYVGGAVGHSSYSSIRGTVKNEGIVSAASSSYVGGIAGYVAGTTVAANSTLQNFPTKTSSTATVAVEGLSFVGGVFGYFAPTASIDTVKFTSGQSSTWNGSTNSNKYRVGGTGTYIGGIFGYLTSSTVISLSTGTTGALMNSLEIDLGNIGHQIGGIAGCVEKVNLVGNASNKISNYGRVLSRKAGEVNFVSGTSYNSSALLGGIVGVLLANMSFAEQALIGTGVLSVNGDYVGGIVGLLSGDLSNCVNNCPVGYNGSSDFSKAYTGGVVGYLLSGSVANCNSTSTARVNGKDYTGGVIGYMVAGTLSYTSNNLRTGPIYAYGSYVGGYVGYMAGSSQMTVSVGVTVTNNNTITYSGTAAATSIGGIVGCMAGSSAITGGALLVQGAYAISNATSLAVNYVGGIIGAYSSSGTLDLSGTTVSGAISGTSYVGGAVGYASAGTLNVSKFANTVAVSASTSYAGGVVGGSAAGCVLTVKNCYNTAAISASGASGYAGGIIGNLAGTSACIVQYCYNSGNVTASGTNAYAGGIAGGISAAQIDYSYCLVGTITATNHGGIVAASTGTITRSVAFFNGTDPTSSQITGDRISYFGRYMLFDGAASPTGGVTMTVVPSSSLAWTDILTNNITSFAVSGKASAPSGTNNYYFDISSYAYPTYTPYSGATANAASNRVYYNINLLTANLNGVSGWVATYKTIDFLSDSAQNQTLSTGTGVATGYDTSYNGAQYTGTVGKVQIVSTFANTALAPLFSASSSIGADGSPFTANIRMYTYANAYVAGSTMSLSDTNLALNTAAAGEDSNAYTGTGLGAGYYFSTVVNVRDVQTGQGPTNESNPYYCRIAIYYGGVIVGTFEGEYLVKRLGVTAEFEFDDETFTYRDSGAEFGTYYTRYTGVGQGSFTVQYDGEDLSDFITASFRIVTSSVDANYPAASFITGDANAPAWTNGFAGYFRTGYTVTTDGVEQAVGAGRYVVTISVDGSYGGMNATGNYTNVSEAAYIFDILPAILTVDNTSFDFDSTAPNGGNKTFNGTSTFDEGGYFSSVATTFTQARGWLGNTVDGNDNTVFTFPSNAITLTTFNYVTSDTYTVTASAGKHYVTFSAALNSASAQIYNDYAFAAGENSTAASVTVMSTDYFFIIKKTLSFDLYNVNNYFTFNGSATPSKSWDSLLTYSGAIAFNTTYTSTLGLVGADTISTLALTAYGEYATSAVNTNIAFYYYASISAYGNYCTSTPVYNALSEDYDYEYSVPSAEDLGSYDSNWVNKVVSHVFLTGTKPSIQITGTIIKAVVTASYLNFNYQSNSTTPKNKVYDGTDYYFPNYNNSGNYAITQNYAAVTGAVEGYLPKFEVVYQFISKNAVITDNTTNAYLVGTGYYVKLRIRLSSDTVNSNYQMTSEMVTVVNQTTISITQRTLYVRYNGGVASSSGTTPTTSQRINSMTYNGIIPVLYTYVVNSGTYGTPTSYGTYFQDNSTQRIYTAKRFYYDAAGEIFDDLGVLTNKSNYSNVSRYVAGINLGFSNSVANYWIGTYNVLQGQMRNDNYIFCFVDGSSGTVSETYNTYSADNDTGFDFTIYTNSSSGTMQYSRGSYNPNTAPTALGDAARVIDLSTWQSSGTNSTNDATGASRDDSSTNFFTQSSGEATGMGTYIFEDNTDTSDTNYYLNSNYWNVLDDNYYQQAGETSSYSSLGSNNKRGFEQSSCGTWFAYWHGWGYNGGAIRGMGNDCSVWDSVFWIEIYFDSASGVRASLDANTDVYVKLSAFAVGNGTAYSKDDGWVIGFQFIDGNSAQLKPTSYLADPSFNTTASGNGLGGYPIASGDSANTDCAWVYSPSVEIPESTTGIRVLMRCRADLNSDGNAWFAGDGGMDEGIAGIKLQFSNAPITSSINESFDGTYLEHNGTAAAVTTGYNNVYNYFGTMDDHTLFTDFALNDTTLSSYATNLANYNNYYSNLNSYWNSSTWNNFSGSTPSNVMSNSGQAKTKTWGGILKQGSTNAFGSLDPTIQFDSSGTSSSGAGWNIATDAQCYIGYNIRLTGNLLEYAKAGKLRISVQAVVYSVDASGDSEHDSLSLCVSPGRMSYSAQENMPTFTSLMRQGDASVDGNGDPVYTRYTISNESSSNIKMCVYDLYPEANANAEYFEYMAYVTDYTNSGNKLACKLRAMKISYSVMSDVEINPSNDISSSSTNTSVSVNSSDATVSNWYFKGKDVEFVSSGSAVGYGSGWTGINAFAISAMFGFDVTLGGRLARAATYGTNLSLTLTYNVSAVSGGIYLVAGINNGSINVNNSRKDVSSDDIPADSSSCLRMSTVSSTGSQSTTIYIGSSQAKSGINDKFYVYFYFIFPTGSTRADVTGMISSVSLSFASGDYNVPANGTAVDSNGGIIKDTATSQKPGRTPSVAGVYSTYFYEQNTDENFVTNQYWYIKLKDLGTSSLWNPQIWVVKNGTSYYVNTDSILWNTSTFVFLGTGETDGLEVHGNYSNYANPNAANNFTALELKIYNFNNYETIYLQMWDNAGSCLYSGGSAQASVSQSFTGSVVDAIAPTVSYTISNLSEWTSPVTDENDYFDDDDMLDTSLADGKVLVAYVSELGAEYGSGSNTFYASGIQEVKLYYMTKNNSVISWNVDLLDQNNNILNGIWQVLEEVTTGVYQWTEASPDQAIWTPATTVEGVDFAAGYHARYVRALDTNTSFHIAAIDNAGNSSVYPEYSYLAHGAISEESDISAGLSYYVNINGVRRYIYVYTNNEFVKAGTTDIDNGAGLRVFIPDTDRIDVTQIYEEVVSFGAVDARVDTTVRVTDITSGIAVTFNSDLGNPAGWTNSQITFGSTTAVDGVSRESTVDGTATSGYYIRTGTPGTSSDVSTMLAGYYFVGWAYQLRSTNIGDMTYTSGSTASATDTAFINCLTDSTTGFSITNGAYTGQKLLMSSAVLGTIPAGANSVVINNVTYAWVTPTDTGLNSATDVAPAFTTCTNPHASNIMATAPIYQPSTVRINVCAIYTRILPTYTENSTGDLNSLLGYAANARISSKVYNGKMTSVCMDNSYDVNAQNATITNRLSAGISGLNKYSLYNYDISMSKFNYVNSSNSYANATSTQIIYADAGTYTKVYTLYNAASTGVLQFVGTNTFSFSVSRLAINWYSYTQNDFTYDAQIHSVQAVEGTRPTGFAANASARKITYTISYSPFSSGIGTPSSPSNVNNIIHAGTYRITAVIDDSLSTVNNYDAQTITLEFTVNQATTDSEWTSPFIGTEEYSGEYVTPTRKVLTSITSDLYCSRVFTYSGSTSECDVGTYTLTLAGFASSLSDFTKNNYSLPSTVNFTWYITPKVASVSWYIDDVTTTRYSSTISDVLTYDGDYHTLHCFIENLATGDSQSDFVFAYTGIQSERNANEGDSAYSVTVSSLGNSNYTLTDAEVVTIGWYINKLDVSVSPGSTGVSKIYDGTTAFYTNGTYVESTSDVLVLGTHYSFSDFVTGDDVYITLDSAEFNNKNVLNAENVTLFFSISGDDSANYDLQNTSIVITGTITPKAIGVEWSTEDSFVFNGLTKTYSGATPTGVISGDTITVAYSSHDNFVTSAVDVATYTAELSSIGGGDADNYQLPSSDLTHEWNITPLEAVVTFSGGPFTYNGTDQSAGITAQIVCANNSAKTMTYPTSALSFTRTTNTDLGETTVFKFAGDYTVVANEQTGTGWSNFSVTTEAATGAFTINKKTLTAANVQWYTTALHLIEYTSAYTYNASTQGVYPMLTSGTISGDLFTYGVSSNTARNAGTYTATLANVGNANYMLSAFVTKNWVINKKLATATASDQSFIYGDAITLNQHSYTLTGIYSSDTSTVTVLLTLTNAFSSMQNPDVGTYGNVIVVTAFDSNSNYTITGDNGNVIITRRLITINYNTAVLGTSTAWKKVYDGNNSFLVYYNSTATYDDYAGNNGISANEFYLNYCVGFVVGGSSVGLVAGDAVTITVVFEEQTAYANETANAYYEGSTYLDLLESRALKGVTITAEGTDSGNYYFEYESGSYLLTSTIYDEQNHLGGLITQLELRLAESSFTKIYDGTVVIESSGEDYVFSSSYAPLVINEETDDVNIVSIEVVSKNVGTQRITLYVLGGNDGYNYHIVASEDEELAKYAVISPKLLTITGTSNGLTKTYDGSVDFAALYDVTTGHYTIAGALDGENVSLTVTAVTFNMASVSATEAYVYYTLAGNDSSNYYTGMGDSAYFTLSENILVLPKAIEITPLSGLHKIYTASSWTWTATGTVAAEDVFTSSETLYSGNSWAGGLKLQVVNGSNSNVGLYTIISDNITTQDEGGDANYSVTVVSFVPEEDGDPDNRYEITKRPLTISYKNTVQSYRSSLADWVDVGYSFNTGKITTDTVVLTIENGWKYGTYTEKTTINSSANAYSSAIGHTTERILFAYLAEGVGKNDNYILQNQPTLILAYYKPQIGTDYFLIETLADLLELDASLNEGLFDAFMLTGDISGYIEISDSENADGTDESLTTELGMTEFSPILGTTSYGGFKGIFDGNGHTISDLVITSVGGTGTVNVGLFAALAGGVIKNLNLRNITINSYSGTANVGGIVGYNKAGQVLNSSFEGEINVVGSNVSVGAIVGRSEQARTFYRSEFVNGNFGDVDGNYAVANLNVKANATSATVNVGGIVGTAQGYTYYDTLTEVTSINKVGIYRNFAFVEIMTRVQASASANVGNVVGYVNSATVDGTPVILAALTTVVDSTTLYNSYLSNAAAVAGITSAGVGASVSFTLNGSSVTLASYVLSQPCGNVASFGGTSKTYDQIIASVTWNTSSYVDEDSGETVTVTEAANTDTLIADVLKNYVYNAAYFTPTIFASFNTNAAYGTSARAFSIGSYRQFVLMELYGWASFALTSDITIPAGYLTESSSGVYNYTAKFDSFYGVSFANSDNHTVSIESSVSSSATAMFVAVRSGVTLPTVTTTVRNKRSSTI